MQSLGLPSIDARDEYVGMTLQSHAYSYRKSADGKRPVAQVTLVHDVATEFVVHIFQSDANPQGWFKDLCWHIDGRDELCLSKRCSSSSRRANGRNANVLAERSRRVYRA